MLLMPFFYGGKDCDLGFNEKLFFVRNTMQRKGKEGDGEWDYLKDRDKSLMEKWKEHVKVKKEIGGTNRNIEVHFTE